MDVQIEDAIAVMRAFDEALGRRDYLAASQLCLDDLTFFGSGAGEECSGAGALAPMFEHLHQQLSDDFLDWTVDFDNAPTVTIDNGVAVVVATGTSTLKTTAGQQESRYRVTTVLRHTPNGWRIWMYHGSEPQAW